MDQVTLDKHENYVTAKICTNIPKVEGMSQSLLRFKEHPNALLPKMSIVET